MAPPARARGRCRFSCAVIQVSCDDEAEGPQPKPHNLPYQASRGVFGRHAERTDDRVAAGAASQGRCGARRVDCARKIPAGCGAKTRRSGPVAMKADWLGWLDIVDQRTARCRGAAGFRPRQLRAEHFTDVLLLGMGGSSLGPDVLAKSLGSAPGYPKLHVLDSTDPEQVRRFEDSVDLAHTLFIVASKSGTTLEPNVLMDYFFARATAAIGGSAGTTTSSPSPIRLRSCKRPPRRKAFAASFSAFPSIGGRYSVLSKFGLVPLAAIGHDVRAFLETAGVMARACGPQTPPAENPGVALGLTIGVLAGGGRDKLTLIASPSIAPFGAWVEQLVAESTGKNGHGVIPIADEPLGDTSVYGSGSAVRLSARRRDIPIRRRIKRATRCNVPGHPVVRIALLRPCCSRRNSSASRWRPRSPARSSASTRSTSPTSKRARSQRAQMTEAFEKTGSLPIRAAGVRGRRHRALYGCATTQRRCESSAPHATLESWFKAHFGPACGWRLFRAPRVPRRHRARGCRALQSLRATIRDRRHVATCLQFGPRFLHSTGQAYKGGPNYRRISADHGPAGGRSRDSGTQGELRRDRGGASGRRLPGARPSAAGGRCTRTSRRTSTPASPPSPRRSGCPEVMRRTRYCETSWRSRA